MLLLSQTNALSGTDAVVALVSLIIIALAVWAIYSKLHKTPNGDVELQKFFDSIKDAVQNRIIEMLNGLDFSKLDKESFIESYTKFTEEVINDIWNLCNQKIEELYKKDNELLYTILVKTITIDKVRELVITIMDDSKVQDKFVQIFNMFIKTTEEQTLAEEKALTEQAKNDLIENIDDIDEEKLKSEDTSSIPVLDPTKLEGVDYPINPPKEEESDTVSEDDESVEILKEAADIDEKIEAEINKEE